MNSKLFTYAMLFLIVFSYGQQLERQVIGSAGETKLNSEIILDFTVGETVVGDLSNNSISLSQGFRNSFISIGIKINPIVFLQGAAINPNSGEEDLMRNDLRALYLPITSPYSDGLVCDISAFLDGGATGNGPTNDNIVDWIFIELRDKNDNTNVITGRSALLQRDGDIVDIDGVSILEIEAESDDYYVAIRHRNHLGIISANTVSLSQSSVIMDFSDANNQITWGNNAQGDFGSPSDIVAMWTGNANGDNRVRNQGSGNDNNTIRFDVSTHPGNTSGSNLYFYFAYDNSDLDMDGRIRYQGSGNDINVLRSVIASHPDNIESPSQLFFISEQLPEN